MKFIRNKWKNQNARFNILIFSWWSLDAFQTFTSTSPSIFNNAGDTRGEFRSTLEEESTTFFSFVDKSSKLKDPDIFQSHNFHLLAKKWRCTQRDSTRCIAWHHTSNSRPHHTLQRPRRRDNHSLRYVQSKWIHCFGATNNCPATNATTSRTTSRSCRHSPLLWRSKNTHECPQRLDASTIRNFMVHWWRL